MIVELLFNCLIDVLWVNIYLVDVNCISLLSYVSFVLKMDVIYKVLVIEIGSMDFIIDFLVNICLIYNGVYKYYYVVGVY